MHIAPHLGSWSLWLFDEMQLPCSLVVLHPCDTPPCKVDESFPPSSVRHPQTVPSSSSPCPDLQWICQRTPQDSVASDQFPTYCKDKHRVYRKYWLIHETYLQLGLQRMCSCLQHMQQQLRFRSKWRAPPLPRGTSLLVCDWDRRCPFRDHWSAGGRCPSTWRRTRRRCRPPTMTFSVTRAKPTGKRIFVVLHVLRRRFVMISQLVMRHYVPVGSLCCPIFVCRKLLSCSRRERDFVQNTSPYNNNHAICDDMLKHCLEVAMHYVFVHLACRYPCMAVSIQLEIPVLDHGMAGQYG